MHNNQELRHLIYQHYRIRVSPAATEQHMIDLLNTKVVVTPQHKVNQMRDEVSEYVAKYRDQLSLWCDGKCYNHTDVMVVNCYQNLLEHNGKSS